MVEAAIRVVRVKGIDGLTAKTMAGELGTSTQPIFTAFCSIDTKVVEKDKTKNETSYRSFPLFPEVRDLLLNLKKDEQKNREFFGDTYVENDYIFKRPNGKVYLPAYVSHKFADLLVKYNLPHIRFHDLRHSCASLLLTEGCSLKDVQDWMGHAYIKMTGNIYGHLDLSRKKITSGIIQKSLSEAC